MPAPAQPPSSALDIARAGTARVDSPEHRRFARLLAQIEAARQRLAEWQQNLPLFSSAWQVQVAPLKQRQAAARRAWAFELEQVLLKGRWSRAESATLSRMICEIADADLDDPPSDPELLALHDRHAEQDHASAQQQELDSLKGLLERIGGLDLGDTAAASPEELLERAREQMAQRHAQQAAQARAHAQAHADSRRKRKPSKAELRAEEDARLATQSVRDVYRKLAAALHPDRAEPGATPEQQARRHESMSRANAAYAAGDLLALLTLQLEIEQVDIAHAATVAAAQVRHFNKVLAGQLREIEAEIGDREHAFLASYGIAPTQRPHPGKLGVFLKDEVRLVLSAEQGLQREQRVLRGGVAAARRYLKMVAAQYRHDDAYAGVLPL